MTASGSQSRDRLFRRKANPSLSAKNRGTQSWVPLFCFTSVLPFLLTPFDNLCYHYMYSKYTRKECHI